MANDRSFGRIPISRNDTFTYYGRNFVISCNKTVAQLILEEYERKKKERTDAIEKKRIAKSIRAELKDRAKARQT